MCGRAHGAAGIPIANSTGHTRTVGTLKPAPRGALITWLTRNQSLAYLTGTVSRAQRRGRVVDQLVALETDVVGASDIEARSQPGSICGDVDLVVLRMPPPSRPSLAAAHADPAVALPSLAGARQQHRYETTRTLRVARTIMAACLRKYFCGRIMMRPCIMQCPGRRPPSPPRPATVG